MTSRQRLLSVLKHEMPDRLPVTTHELMPTFLESCEGGMSQQEFFTRFHYDRIHWIHPVNMHPCMSGTLLHPKDVPQPVVSAPQWQIHCEPCGNSNRRAQRFTVSTPRGELSMVIEGNAYTVWIAEHLIKKKSDIDLIGEYLPDLACDIPLVKREAEILGDQGIIRGVVPWFDFYGQPGCWQDAACLYPIELLIMETFDDPFWVKSLLSILQKRKLAYIETMGSSSAFDLIELGGGDGSTTVISPAIFREFVAPFDAPIVKALHKAGVMVVYHTCGGMMPILEDIADMGVDAMETFTPSAMGGDTDLTEAKRRIGSKVCMIGGLDQNRYLQQASVEQTRAEVRRCFSEAGVGGGFILAPSDHFFEAEAPLLEAVSREAAECRY